jgi:8-oxo-dGTP diphosphatase
MPAADQGLTNDRYSLIPRTLIFIFRGESVLLLKGAPHKRLWANFYNGVGGHIKKGEDALTAAKRELLEETGIKPEHIRLCGTVTVDRGDETGIGLYVFKGTSQKGSLQPSPEGELEWVPLSEVESKSLVEDLPILLPRVINHKTYDSPFSAHYYYNQGEQLVVRFAE